MDTADHELTVVPQRKLKKGQRITTIVCYDGVPITQEIIVGPEFTIEAGFMHTDDGAVIAGEPEVAATWYPVNDHPLDKAAYTFIVTVPKGLEVVGNGRLVGRRTRGDSTTWIWDAREPMASYLTTATIGQFDLRKYRTEDGLLMYDAIDPDLYDEPSDPEDDDSDNLFFALETQTRPVYSKDFFTDSVSGDSVVVHEIAHQWFGDSVALAAWQHIWLNEGFATYAEWLWSEDQGLGTTQEIFDAAYSIPEDDPFWDVVIGDPGVEFLFDNAVYFRGAMTLHALRNEVGDRDFFRIIRAWAAKKAGGNGTTDQFIALAERISGEQLDKLFEVWLFTGSKPVVDEFSTSVAPSETAPPAADLERMSRGATRLRR